MREEWWTTGSDTDESVEGRIVDLLASVRAGAATDRKTCILLSDGVLPSAVVVTRKPSACSSCRGGSRR